MHVVILNSGGVDSRVTAKLAKEMGHVVHSLYVDTLRQNVQGTRPAAEKTASLYCVDHLETSPPVDWFMTDKLHDNSNLDGLPYSAPLIHIYGAQYAVYKGWDAVFTGIREESARIVNFIEAFNNLTKACLATKIIPLYGPIYTWSKQMVGDKAKELSIPLEDTYSCARYPPCGRCHQCMDRRLIGL